ncbi:MAG: YbjN domain-containing protein [Actinomycetota bacterium]
MNSVIRSYLSDREVDFVESEGAFSFTVPGERKLSIGAAIATTASGARIESFFMRAPMQDAPEVFKLLLSRNARGRLVWFAIDALGDAYLLGFIARNAVTYETLDELLGEIVTTSDEMFDVVMRTGFRDYLERDLMWRAKQH